MAELGPLGLLALLGVVVVPLVAAIRARRSPFVAPALAGFVALAVHAGVDWDWEVPAVVIAGLTCAGVLLLAHDAGGPGRWTVGTGARAVILSAIVALSRALVRDVDGEPLPRPGVRGARQERCDDRDA